ncbi:MAG: sugar ABC transporter permease [Treponema sp.]|jgi:multiple sugar transport system permease protein|nr:sugar ABC transporter permease [Treponema sp.]
MRKKNYQTKEYWIAYLFVAAPILQFFLLLLGPLIYSMYASFTDWNVLLGARFIGTGNYLNLLKDAKFGKALVNTLFLMLGIPIGMFLSLLVAILLNRKIVGSKVFRLIYYLPVISSAVAVSVVWKWIYNPDYGLLNSFIKQVFNVQGPFWLYDEHWIKPALIIVGVWRSIGAWMLFYLAALQNIPRQYYEAAELDGGGALASFIHITLPMVSPITFYLVIMGIIGSFQTFAEIYIFAPTGGTGYSAATVVFHIWDKAFRAYEMGYACAMAWVLGIMIFIVTYIQFRFSNTWVQEAN